MIKNAIILAAGTGSRLNFHKPKGCLNIYGKSLIAHSVDALHQRGIRPILGTGFASECYDFLRLETCKNVDYEKTGSLWTLRNMKHVKGDVLILESDILYDPCLLDAIIKCPEPNVVLFGKGHPKDAVFADVDEKGYLKTMSKDCPASENIAVGISKLSESTFSHLNMLADHVLKKSPLQHYDYIYEQLPERFWVLNVEGAFTEIDDQEQLEYAINYVYPRISFN